MAALPAGHRLAKRKRIGSAELAEEPFVLYTRATGPSVHDAIVGYCREAGFTPRIEQEAADVQTIVSLVAAGLGVSLLIAPTPPIDPERGRLPRVVRRPATVATLRSLVAGQPLARPGATSSTLIV